MTFPSFVSWSVGIAVVTLLSVLLRYLAGEARKVAISRRGAAHISTTPDKPTFKRAA